MALCTVCSMDPCPHLKASGGSAGAPPVTAGPKYAPSTKPTCPSCDRVHRNIGTDNQPVCAWRTYSKAKGEDFTAFTPEAVDEFARWYRSGGWSAPVRKTKKAAAATTATASTTTEATTEAPATNEAPTVTIPSFEELEADIIADDLEVQGIALAQAQEILNEPSVADVEAALAAL